MPILKFKISLIRLVIFLLLFVSMVSTIIITKGRNSSNVKFQTKSEIQLQIPQRTRRAVDETSVSHMNLQEKRRARMKSLKKRFRRSGLESFIMTRQTEVLEISQINSKKSIDSEVQNQGNGSSHEWNNGKKYRTKVSKRPYKILLIGDETIDFLSGNIVRGRCKIVTESYYGLTIPDAMQRVSAIFAKKDRKPNKVIIHIGNNDIIEDLPLVTSTVIEKMKNLVDELKNIAFVESPSKCFAISGIFPKNLLAMSFNHKVHRINSDVGWYAQNNGIDFLDHSHIFWHNGHLKTDLYRSDGTFNENGMHQIEESLFENKWCQRDHNDDWLKVQEKRYNDRPSLELKDILPVERKLYDRHVAPRQNGEPTAVYFHVTVLSVDSIDEESMTYVADIFLAQSWKDYRLRLPGNMTEGYRILDVGWLNFIWRPDSFFKNAKKVTFHDMSVPNHYLWLYYDKTLLYMTKLTLELTCAMKFEAYPHDIQNCSMMIESLSHTTDDLIFLWNTSSPLVLSMDIELPQLDIVSSSTQDCTLEYSTGNFTCLAVVFHLKRRLGYHLFHTYIPTTLIVVMSWISFWIRPEAIPARVTLGVTSLLTLATQNTQSQSSLPPVSYVKAIDVWMSSCTVFVFMSLMEFAVVNHFMGHIATTQGMKGFHVEEKNKRNYEPKRGKGNFASNWSSDPMKDDMGAALTIDKFSRVFFPLSFCILNIVYWFTYTKSS